MSACLSSLPCGLSPMMPGPTPGRRRPAAPAAARPLSRALSCSCVVAGRGDPAGGGRRRRGRGIMVLPDGATGRSVGVGRGPPRSLFHYRENAVHSARDGLCHPGFPGWRAGTTGRGKGPCRQGRRGRPAGGRTVPDGFSGAAAIPCGRPRPGFPGPAAAHVLPCWSARRPIVPENDCSGGFPSLSGKRHEPGAAPRRRPAAAGLTTGCPCTGRRGSGYGPGPRRGLCRPRGRPHRGCVTAWLGEDLTGIRCET
ncbi:translation initiation factor 2 InfB [Candidatus Protofrankia datiscae]|uniref:Translation initiation factor 2 InfB n=1 Tax=Candidatus Protofrankia datiscae TaxID=2716812 RepID=F8AWX7_9ACTN|nr:translation initiation factor 2 InfB [Candidatus Protofrankia datiscae]